MLGCPRALPALPQVSAGAERARTVCGDGETPGVREGAGEGAVVVSGAHREGGEAERKRCFGQGDSGELCWVKIATFFLVEQREEWNSPFFWVVLSRFRTGRAAEPHPWDHSGLVFNECWNFPSPGVLNNL